MDQNKRIIFNSFDQDEICSDHLGNKIYILFELIK